MQSPSCSSFGDGVILHPRRQLQGKAALLLALGLVSGVVTSWFATRTIEAFLFGAGRHDPITILSICALLALSGLIAAIISARRAAFIDPMQSLRTE